MFRAFGSLLPRALTALTPTTVVLTFSRIVDFNLLPLRFRLALPGFPWIFLRSIAESPVFDQPELPSHMKDKNVIYIWNWSPFCLLSQPLSLPFLLPQQTSLDFSCGRTLRGKPRFTYQAVLILALILSGNVAALLDWPLVQLIAQLGNCVPSLILLADLASGQGYLLVTLQLIRLSRNTSLPSSRNKQKQGSPLANLYLFSSTISLNCAPTFVSGHFFHPYPPLERYIASRDMAFFCLDFYSGDRATDLGRVYTKEVLLLPGKQGLLFHHKFGKTLRGKDSNIFAVKKCLHDSIVCPVVNLTTYVRLADLMNIKLRESFLFRATDPKGRVSTKPFVGSTVANRLRLHLTTLKIHEGETMHSFRSGCSITLSLLGASDDQVARQVGWKSVQTAQYYFH